MDSAAIFACNRERDLCREDGPNEGRGGSDATFVLNRLTLKTVLASARTIEIFIQV